jgi:hypothetical protein
MGLKATATNGKSRTTSMVADETWAPAGVTGDRIATANKAAPNVGHLIALNPAT